jgi:hypothetical protein
VYIARMRRTEIAHTALLGDSRIDAVTVRATSPRHPTDNVKVSIVEATLFLLTLRNRAKESSAARSLPPPTFVRRQLASVKKGNAHPPLIGTLLVASTRLKSPEPASAHYSRAWLTCCRGIPILLPWQTFRLGTTGSPRRIPRSRRRATSRVALIPWVAGHSATSADCSARILPQSCRHAPVSDIPRCFPVPGNSPMGSEGERRPLALRLGSRLAVHPTTLHRMVARRGTRAMADSA